MTVRQYETSRGNSRMDDYWWFWATWTRIGYNSGYVRISKLQYPPNPDGSPPFPTFPTANSPIMKPSGSGVARGTESRDLCSGKAGQRSYTIPADSVDGRPEWSEKLRSRFSARQASLNSPQIYLEGRSRQQCPRELTCRSTVSMRWGCIAKLYEVSILRGVEQRETCPRATQTFRGREALGKHHLDISSTTAYLRCIYPSPMWQSRHSRKPSTTWRF